jgi:hypothetical protein
MRSRRLLATGLVLVVLLATFSVAAADVPGPGWWTAQQIQATTTGDPLASNKTNVNLTAYDQSTTPGYDCGSKNLSQYEAFVFVPTASWGITPNCGTLPAGFKGSAILSSNYDVVAIVEETNQLVAPLGASGGTADASYRGTSDLDTDTTLRFPAYKNNHAGETSTFYIQNAGDKATKLKATFQECAASTPGCAGAGGTFVYNLTTPLEPNRMAIIVPADAGAPSGTGHFGSLTVESVAVGADAPQKLAGIVNEAATTASGAARYLKSTRAFSAAEYDTELYAPVIKHSYPVGAGAGTKWSALQIQNVGAAPDSFTISYTIAGSSTPARIGTTITDNTTCVNIPVGQTCFVMTLFPVAGSGTAQLQPGEYASAKVTSLAQKMVAVVNEETLYSYSPAADKQFATYSAVPKKTTSMHVSVPAYKEEWVGRYMGVTVQNVGGAPTTITARVKNANPGPSGPPAADLVAQKTNVLPGASVTFWLLSQNQAQTYGSVSIVSGTPAQFVKSNNSMDVQATQNVAVIVNQEDSYINKPAVKLDAASYEGFPLP